MNAAVAGLPQLALGLTDDGIEMGRRFSVAGSGLVLPGLTATREQICDAVGELIEDSRLREAAERVRADIAGRPSPADQVMVLEKLARTGELSSADIPDRASATAQPVG
jgi:UDP:flavonoid glycosyltransferase YjiC (YdhE family)